jgi:endonuclease YncB( thermonuclease family)
MTPRTRALVAALRRGIAVAVVTVVAASCTPSAVFAPASAEAPASPSALASFRPSGATVTAKVVRVVDGDTIVVEFGGRRSKVRYIGMDAPETVDPSRPVQWMGPEASAANASLVAGKQVVLEKDVSETDRYGRLLRYVWLTDGRSWTLVDLELVERGFASVATFPPDVKYVELLRAAERRARGAGVGLWRPRPS